MKRSSSEEDSKSKKSSSKHKTEKKDKKKKKEKKDKKDKKDKKNKDGKKKEKSDKEEEKEKIEMSEKQETPADQKSDEKGFEVDERRLLIISGFDDSLNIKFTNQLADLFKKISVRFKTTPKIDTMTCLKTLHNMYLQHFNKSFKNTDEFNSQATLIIFCQIIKYMKHEELIWGKIFEFLCDSGIFDIPEIENANKMTIECDRLQKLFKDYTLRKELDRTKIEDKKLFLSLEDRATITIIVMKFLLKKLTESTTNLPKKKNSMLKIIELMIKIYGSNEELNSDFKQTIERNKNVKFWVFDWWKYKSIVIVDENSKNFEIKMDQVTEYLENINNDQDEWTNEILEWSFLE